MLSMLKTINTMDVRGVIYGTRNGKPLTTFNPAVLPVGFFVVAGELGYAYTVTGNLELTHEMEIGMEEFNSIIALAMEVEE